MVCTYLKFGSLSEAARNPIWMHPQGVWLLLLRVNYGQVLANGIPLQT